MKEVVIIDALRTPIGKGNMKNGYYRDSRSDDLAATVVKSLLEPVLFDHRLIEDVIFGCAMQQDEQGLNVARQVALLAGVPIESSAVSVNRLCGSSMQALHQATQAIIANCGDIFIIGGLEHMAHIPMESMFNPNPKLFKEYSKAVFSMGISTEFLTIKHGISRKVQDEFALASHQKAVAATKKGWFKQEIVPVRARLDDGNWDVVSVDQGPREDTTLEALNALNPAFNPQGGSITAGNSSQISDGASAMLVMSMDKAKELKLKPIARVKAMAVAGVDPSVFGIGPVPATKKALQRAGLSVDDIDVFELNEAFAGQSLAVMKELGIDESKVNLNGGAIALGHPLGCSGARITTTLIHIMRRKKLNLGVATMCIGMGQGIATVIEAV